MSDALGTPAQLLELVLGHLPQQEEPEDDGVNTGAFLARLARSWPTTPSIQDQHGLAAICRTLSVTNNVASAYDVRWTKPLRRKMLDSSYWPVLIALLSIPFAVEGEQEPIINGESLKRLNAAFTALDIANTLEVDCDLPGLASYAVSHLNRILQP